MAGTTGTPAARTGAAFEVERLETEGGRLVVSGHWSGVRGMRFVRPTLLVGGRQVLATLDHKPWAPREDEAWTAAFPWEDRGADLAGAALSVAPTVTVPLVVDADDAQDAEVLPPPPPPPAPTATSHAERAAARESERIAAQLDARGHELAALATERDALREQVAALSGQLDAARAAASAQRRAADGAVAGREDLDRARAAAERERDHALAQRDEALEDRRAALRTRARMEEQLGPTLERLRDAEQARDRAVAERDEARAQRDDVLLAHRSLQRQVQAGRALEARGDRSERPRADRGPGHEQRRALESDEPAGVVSIPASRSLAADIERPELARRADVSRYDLWAIRFFGTVAAVCFILLLALLARVFLL